MGCAFRLSSAGGRPLPQPSSPPPLPRHHHHHHHTHRSVLRLLSLPGRRRRVYLTKHKRTGTLAAIKCIPKGMLLSPKSPNPNHKLAQQAAAERDLLFECRPCPFVADLLGFGQTDWSVYIVTDYAPGGELFTYLRKRGRFSDVRFFAC